MKKIWKKKSAHVVGFMSLFLILFIIFDSIFYSIRYTDYSWFRIQSVDDDIDVLILGNSHAYTSTDAAVLSDLWNVDVEIFASSDQNMEETLIHLKEALKYKTPEYIFLEVFSPTHDNRNTLQNEKRGVLMLDMDGIRNPIDKMSALSTILPWNKIPEGMFQLLRPTNMWERYDFKRNKMVGVTDNHGFKTVTTNTYATGIAVIEDVEKEYSSINSVSALTDYNEKALMEFLDITREKGIKVILYKAPTMTSTNFGQVRKVFYDARNYENVIAHIDYHQYMTEIGLELGDFYDGGHLNRRGAEKFTYFFATQFSELLGYECDWTKIWGYKNEKVEQLSDGMWSYMMENYAENTLYKFILYKDGEIIASQEYSKENSFVYDIDIRNADDFELYCSMIPDICISEGDYCPDRINCIFMKQNSCVIN